jgi:signal transduction histidine kinase
MEIIEREKMVQTEREHTRSRIASDLHDDISSTLGSIALYSESLKRQSPQLSEQQKSILERIGSLSSETLDRMSDIIWSIAPEHDSLNDLLAKIKNHAVEFCSINKIEYEIEICDLKDDLIITENFRRNIYLIFKEGLNNVFKHSRATSVKISILFTDGNFEMMIKDNGSGFKLNEALHKSNGIFNENKVSGRHQGHGITNMKKRAEEICAAIEINSSPNEGTTIKLSKRMT